MTNYLYDPEVIRTLKSDVERLNLSIPDDPNDPEFDEVLRQVSQRNPALGAQLALARIEANEVKSNQLLREQAQILEGKETVADWFRKTFNKENVNGRPVPNMQLMAIAGGAVAFLALGAFMFWPHPQKAKRTVATTSTTTSTTTPTPSGVAQNPNASAAGGTAPQGGLASPSAGTAATGVASTTAPTSSQLAGSPVPAYMPPSYDGGSASGYRASSGSGGGSVSTYTPSSYSDSSSVKPYTPSYRASPVSSSQTLPKVTPIPDSTGGSTVSVPYVADTAAPSTPMSSAPVYNVPGYPTTYSTPSDSASADASSSGVSTPATGPASAAQSTPSASPRPATGGAVTAYPTPAASKVNVLYSGDEAPRSEQAATGGRHLSAVYGGSATGQATDAVATSGAGNGTGNSAAGSATALSGRRMSVLYGDKTNTSKDAATGTSQSAAGQDVNRTATMVLYQGGQSSAPSQGASASASTPTTEKVLYSAAPAGASAAPNATAGTAGAGTGPTGGGTPFQLGQVIPGVLSFSVDLPENYPMEVFVTTPSDQGTFVWKGTALVDAAKRLSINFTSLGLPSGQEVVIQAVAATRDGTVGLPGKYHLASPSAATDLVRGTFNGLQDAATATLQSGTTTIGNGVTTVSNTAPPVWMSLLGGALNSFKLPSNTNSAITMVRVEKGTPVNILYGISSGGTRQP